MNAETRDLLGAALLHVFLVIVIGMIVGALVWNAERGRRHELEQERMFLEQERVCVSQGGIWTHRDCLTRQEVPR